MDTTAPTEATAGICQKCHVNKAVPDVKYWRNDGTEDANQDNANDAGINDTNRHNQAQVCTACHLHKDQFAASCTNCHGTTGSNYYPDSGAQNGIVAPNRAGKHAAHIARIAAVNALSAANGSTCDWCHPNGAHSGDEANATPEPSELHTGGAATHFKTINNLADTGDGVDELG